MNSNAKGGRSTPAFVVSKHLTLLLRQVRPGAASGAGREFLHLWRPPHMHVVVQLAHVFDEQDWRGGERGVVRGESGMVGAGGTVGRAWATEVCALRSDMSGASRMVIPTKADTMNHRALIVHLFPGRGGNHGI